MRFSTSSGVNIFALQQNSPLYLELSILASPAVTINIELSLALKESVFAIRFGSQ